jgi:hypothetical protein
MTIKSVSARGRGFAVAVSVILWAATAAAGVYEQQTKCNKARVQAWSRFVTCVDRVVAKYYGGGFTPGPFETFRELIYPPFAKCRHKYFAEWAKFQQTSAYSGSTCVGSRFTDNGDGTVTDNLSLLEWEKKTDDGSAHDKDNRYSWTLELSPPYKGNGTALTSFLDTLNGGGFAGGNDWRLPNLAELQSILMDFPCTAASCICPSNPCLDPALGLTINGAYWSTTSDIASASSFASWIVEFDYGNIDGYPKELDTVCARAVREGL